MDDDVETGSCMAEASRHSASRGVETQSTERIFSADDHDIIIIMLEIRSHGIIKLAQLLTMP